MNKRLSTVFSLLVVCTMLCLFAVPAASQELVREKMKSDVGIELLGKALLYNFYYQYTPIKQIGIEAGIGAIGGGTSDDNASLIFIPVGGKFYIIPKDGSLYIAGGGVFLSASTSSGPFDEGESGSASYGYLGLGFEFRAESGFLFRGTAYGLLAGGGFYIWPGLTIGYAF